jgi:hypothetical protein
MRDQFASEQMIGLTSECVIDTPRNIHRVTPKMQKPQQNGDLCHICWIFRVCLRKVDFRPREPDGRVGQVSDLCELELQKRGI